jgi:hypothetical protein
LASTFILWKKRPLRLGEAAVIVGLVVSLIRSSSDRAGSAVNPA